MRFKLDENIGRRGLEFLKAAGHYALTVRDQNLGGATDERLFQVCAGEGRALITLYHDFGQVTRFPPEKSAGVIVLEVGPRASVVAIVDRLRDLLSDPANSIGLGFALDCRAWPRPHPPSPIRRMMVGGQRRKSIGVCASSSARSR